MARLLVLHGPNLNLLGTREPDIYGSATLAQIDADLAERASAHGGHTLESFQSNAEHAIVERIQAARGDIDFILINPAAFTHTSVAIRDALAAVGIPFIEVHLSNPHAREPFRHTSYFTDLAVGIVAGFGPLGYGLALTAAIRHLDSRHPDTPST
jgi:3-dehydroquinate dehydratase-2